MVKAKAAARKGEAEPGDTGSKVQVLDEVVNADFTAARNEYHFRTPVLVEKLSPLLRDQRDVPMLCLILNIIEAVVPGVLMVYGINLWQPPFPLLTRNVAGVAYVVTNLLLFQERFTLLIHFASHRSIFYSEPLNLMINWVVAPFFGIPCGLYKLHHVIMHHIENNHELDMSSTETYQRDSWAEFARYWLHFTVLIYLELPTYCVRTKRFGWLVRIVSGLCVWLMIIVLLMRFVSVTATLWVFVVPHCIAMTAMAFGNWSQHIFIDPKDRHSNFSLTYNCIDTPTNQTTFNDGYHIVHHLNARLHWSEIPGYFYENKEKHIQGGALTFRGVHFLEVGIMVMTGRLRKLAECYVHLGPKESAPTVEVVEARLRSLLLPVPQEPPVAKAGKKDK